MIFIGGAFLAALLSVLVAITLSLHLNVNEFIDISMMCGVLGVDNGTCRTGALNAGYTMLAGLTICLVLSFAFHSRFARPAYRSIDMRFAFGWCLLAAFLLLTVHILVEAFGTKTVTRLGEITRLSSFISLENLLWPLLLQLMNSARNPKFKLMYFSLLLSIVSFSPYRGVLLSVLMFGLALPAIAGAAKQKFQWGALRQSRAIAGVALASLAGFSLLFAMYSNTLERPAEVVSSQAQEESQGKLTQRLAYPIFQAYFAERIAYQVNLPTAWDEILRKARLGRRHNLNENLYGKVYGEGTVGEMTSLYYGEAAANSLSLPLIWIVAGPMLLVAIWLTLGKLGYDVSTLVGIAIWRGSLGGVASVLPALILQILAIVVLSRRAERD